MARYRKIEKIAAMALILLSFAGKAFSSEPSNGAFDAKTQASQPEIVQRVIKIEGTIERPKVIFIVPKARFWSADPGSKSFYDELLAPVAPERGALTGAREGVR